jgi:hypothetical protein
MEIGNAFPYITNISWNILYFFPLKLREQMCDVLQGIKSASVSAFKHNYTVKTGGTIKFIKCVIFVTSVKFVCIS